MIQGFIEYLRHNRGLSTATLENYKLDLQNFARFIKHEHPEKTWSTMTKSIIDEYVYELTIRGMKAATIKRHISALRTFYKTCMAMGMMSENPARYVSTPKLGERLPKVIETEAIRRALSDQVTPAPAKAIIAIIFETGIRLSELMALNSSDIDGKNQSIKVHGKGNKERIVYYGNLTKLYGRAFKPNVYSDRDIRRMVYDALKPHSKAPQLSPHALRHTYASELINNGMSIEAIRKLLGHEHTATTEIYAQMTNETARQMYLQYKPIA